MLTRFCATNFLKHQRYYVPVLVIFLLSRGLTFMQIFWIFTAEAWAIILAEIPSGAMADAGSKRNLNALSRLILIPAFILYAFADGFWGFLIAQSLIGVADAFKSGIFKAYMYDYLEHDGNQASAKFTDWVGKTKFWSRTGEAVGGIGGSIIASIWGFKFCFLLSVIPAVLNFVNCALFPNIPNPISEELKKRSWSGNVLRVASDSVKHVTRDRYLLVLILNSGILMFIFKSMGYLYQPFLRGVGIPILYFGLIYTIGNIISALFSRYAQTLEKRLGRISAINLLGWIYLLPLGVLAFGSKNPALVSCFILVFSIKSIRNPIALHELNARVGKGMKATVMSIDVLVRSLFCFFFLPTIGWMMDHLSMSWVMALMIGVQLLNQLLLMLRESMKARYTQVPT